MADKKSEETKTRLRYPFGSMSDSQESQTPSTESTNNLGTVNRYKNAQEYGRAVRQWLWHYHCWNSMNSFMSMMPLYAMSCSPVPGITSHTSTLGGRFQRSDTGHPRRSVINDQRQGTEYLLPSFWKRVAAELIDFTLLFYIKLVVTVVVMRELGYMDGNIDYDVFFNLEELDYDKAFAITSEVIAMEIVNRLLITMFETLCLRRGIGSVGGSTPGKRLMGLKVVSCTDIADLGNNRIFVYPAQNIGWGSAFVRSVIKNFTIAFFFPACLTVFFFKYNRAAYDVLSSTVVVQGNDGNDQMVH